MSAHFALGLLARRPAQADITHCLTPSAQISIDQAYSSAKLLALPTAQQERAHQASLAAHNDFWSHRRLAAA